MRDELQRLNAQLDVGNSSSSVLDQILDIAWELWDTRHRLDDLRSAVVTARALVSLNDDPSAETGGRRLGRLGTLLVICYRRTGDISILNEAVKTLRAALAHLYETDSGRLACLSTLATALSARFLREDDDGDINSAVDISIQVVSSARSTGDSHLDEYCLRAGAALVDRFEGRGDDHDLIDAVSYFRDALAVTEARGGEVSGRCADLARTLMTAYRRWGRDEDLDQAGMLYRRAIDELPAGHPELASHKSGLAGVLARRYERYGDSSDLMPAVELMAEAYELTEDGHPAKLIRLGRLADVLLVRFSRFQDDADLQRAIALLELGIERSGHDRPTRRSMQLGLAGALRLRGLHARDLDDLLRADQLLNDAIDGSSPSADSDPSDIFNQASLSADIFSATGDPGHLESAISRMRAAVDGAPRDSPLYPHAKTYLARFLYDKARYDGLSPGTPLLAECLALAREAALDPALVPALAFVAIEIWAELAVEDDRLAAYERALAVLPLASNHGLTVADSLLRLDGATSIASNACAAFVNAGQIERAVEALEEGRSLSVRLRMRSRADVQELRKTRPDLAEAYHAALEATNALDTALQVDPRGESRHLEDLLTQIREIEGFRRFGLPRTFDEIRTLAGDATVVYMNVSVERCDALIVTMSGVTLVPIRAAASEIARRALGFSKAMSKAVASKYMPDVVVAEISAQDAAAWLWDQVAGPVLEHLQLQPRDESEPSAGWPRIWWIPTGHLVLFPLHVAGHHDHYGRGSIRTTLTVIDRVVSTQLPSIETLAAARRVSEQDAEDIHCLLVATAEAEGESVLSGVVDEVQRVVTQLGRDRVTLLTDQFSLIPDGPSTKADVLDALPRHNWVHFACHAFASPNTPTESQLVLTDHKSRPFSVEDLLAVRPVAPRLAFFSACSTAEISPDLSHEPVHFGTAASLAGYAHAILTLWPVRDDPEIADAVYKGVLDSTTWPRDLSTAAAVHDANRLVRRQRTNAIHRWGATIHQGP